MQTLRGLRRIAGWSQQRLGGVARVTAYAVSMIERGRMTPSIGQATRIADALGVDPRLVKELAGAFAEKEPGDA
ncbi:helix-turn-helix transcriptional regulator [Candidatus Poribacteria bacterium]|nr:helix-turn-helix transcriptional regulator [Candidatus Poribacteria bacterium]